MADEARSALGVGASGDAVAAVQRALAGAAFDPGEPDGVFGARTAQALREFQKSQGLPADGIAGPETMKALQAVAGQARPSKKSSTASGSWAVTGEADGGSQPSSRGSSTDSGDTSADAGDTDAVEASATVRLPPPTVSAAGSVRDESRPGAAEMDLASQGPVGPLRLSSSVGGLLNRTASVTSFELARVVWSDHKRTYPDADRAIAVLSDAQELVGGGLETRPPADWITAVQAAVHPARVGELEPRNRVLHGQLLLYGLGRIDRRLREVYRRAGLDRVLREAITPDPEALFRTPAALSPDAKLIADAPAAEDLLDREGFANTMARLLRQQRSQDEFGTGSILVQIFGPWGSGKTSLAGFLRRALEDPSNTIDAAKPGHPTADVSKETAKGAWLFVTFDAWQHQRTSPPWWWLMDRVYREAQRGRGDTAEQKHRRLSVWWWRWRWAVGTLLFLGVIVGTLFVIGSRLLDWIDSAQAVLAGLIALGGAIGALYATYRTVRSSLLVGSPRTAVALLRSGGDPFRRVRDKYADLIRRVGRPVLVFIDNLDRCRPEYVVELLEGIQTIFSDVPVTYLVAADREWVAHSFETQYESLAGIIGRPGRPLGYLFLEKTFAVSAPLPQPSAETRRRYWQAVLRGDTRHTVLEPVSADLRKEAAEEFATKSLDEVIGAVENLGASSAADRARRDAAATRIVETTMAGEEDHELRPYLPLMEANPRSLKRLRNAVSLARAGDLASGGSIARGQDLDGLIRWSILALRWPTLAVELGKRPRIAELLSKQEAVSDELGKGLAPLAREDALIRLLTVPVEGGLPPDVPGWIRRHLADHDQMLPT